jgi:hypothetical protein
MNSLAYLNLETKKPIFNVNVFELRQKMALFERLVGRIKLRQDKEIFPSFYFEMIEDKWKEHVETWGVLGWLKEHFPQVNLTICIEIDVSKHRIVKRFNQRITNHNVFLRHTGSCKTCRKKAIIGQFNDASINCHGFRLAEQPLVGFSIKFEQPGFPVNFEL